MSAITVKTSILSSVHQVWHYWTNPDKIMTWNFASPDWHCPAAINNLNVGENFSYTMAAKDGSFSFDFGGIYTSIIEHSHIAYELGDGRKVRVDFNEEEGQTIVTETFDPETLNSEELQRTGWQAILDNFKLSVENNK